MSMLGGPVPNSLGTGATNADFFPHGAVVWMRPFAFVLEACVELNGQVHTTVTLTGQARDAVQLNAQIQTAVTTAGQIRDAVQLSGEAHTILALLGEIGDCD